MICFYSSSTKILLGNAKLGITKTILKGLEEKHGFRYKNGEHCKLQLQPFSRKRPHKTKIIIKCIQSNKKYAKSAIIKLLSELLKEEQLISSDIFKKQKTGFPTCSIHLRQNWPLLQLQFTIKEALNKSRSSILVLH